MTSNDYLFSYIICGNIDNNVGETLRRRNILLRKIAHTRITEWQWNRHLGIIGLIKLILLHH